MKALASVDCSDEDGLVFDPATLSIEPIRARTFDFPVLRTAVEKTFSRRGAWPVAATPSALTPAFAENRSRQTLWAGFLRRSRLLDSAPSFPEACTLLQSFLLPVLLPGPAFSKWAPNKGWT